MLARCRVPAQEDVTLLPALLCSSLPADGRADGRAVATRGKGREEDNDKLTPRDRTRKEENQFIGSFFLKKIKIVIRDSPIK